MSTGNMICQVTYSKPKIWLQSLTKKVLEELLSTGKAIIVGRRCRQFCYRDLHKGLDMNKSVCILFLLLSSNIAFGQQYVVFCPSARSEGNSLDTGIDQEPATGDNGITLGDTTIIFEYPISVGDEVTVSYNSEKHPAQVTYASLEFFTISHSPNRIEERYTVHIASETVHYSLVKTYDLPTKILSTQTFAIECNIERAPQI